MQRAVVKEGDYGQDGGGAGVRVAGYHTSLVLIIAYALRYCPPYGRGVESCRTLSHMCEHFPTQKRILRLVLIILLRCCMILGPVESTSEEMY